MVSDTETTRDTGELCPVIHQPVTLNYYYNCTAAVCGELSTIVLTFT